MDEAAARQTAEDIEKGEEILGANSAPGPDERVLAEVHSKTRIASGKYLKITGVKTGKRTFQALSIQGWEKKYHKRALQSPKITPAKGENMITTP